MAAPPSLGLMNRGERRVPCPVAATDRSGVVEGTMKDEEGPGPPPRSSSLYAPISPVRGGCLSTLDAGPASTPRPLVYPIEFPESCRDAVDRARDRAEVQFRERTDGTVSSTEPALDFIADLFTVFGKQICAALRVGELTIGQVHHITSDFVPSLAEHAYEVCGPRKLYHGNAPWSEGDFTRYGVAWLTNSPLWKDHLIERSKESTQEEVRAAEWAG
jgi:hypothetical protein